MQLQLESDAPLSGNMVRSPDESTRTTTTPDVSPGITRSPWSTPRASNSATIAAPAGSSPTWLTMVLRASVRVSQAATFPAAPPLLVLI